MTDTTDTNELAESNNETRSVQFDLNPFLIEAMDAEAARLGISRKGLVSLVFTERYSLRDGAIAAGAQVMAQTA
ncbi:copg antitoxin of type II toxin-antitoxin system [Bacteriophage sp.]|nr:copg antitoxin of type II toxin-antitoxin system [Bacteriophage sp.]